MPFFCFHVSGAAMSDKSDNLRSRAAKELRASRNGGSKEEKADNVKRAASFKVLAENEEWLGGEKTLQPET
jgi:hypothetical protein